MTENKDVEEFVFNVSIPTDAIVSSVRSLSAVVDEAIFDMTNSGISVRAVDAANAALVSLDISNDIFTEFDITDDTKLGIDVNHLLEIFGMAEKCGEVKMALDIDTHKLVIDMTNLSYTLSLLDPTSMRKSPNVPELGLPAEIKLRGSEFKRAVKAASMTGDNMTIGIDGNIVYMESRGDSDVVRLDMTEEDLVGLRPADVSATYSIDYLTDIGKGIGNASEITIDLGRDLPMVLDFSPYPRCDVTYVLAPRIDPE